MAVTASPSPATQFTASEPPLNPTAIEIKPAEAGPLWRLALVGLGPLFSLAVFALLVALFQHPV